MTNLNNRDYSRNELTLYEVGYIKLRTGMAFLAGIFPFIFLISSWVLNRTPMQDSISAYYFTRATERNLFVGILITVAVILFLYEGYSKVEDRVLSLAGVLAAGIALFPTGTHQIEIIPDLPITPHGICAVIFFGCIFYVCIFCSKNTLVYLKDPRKKRHYLIIYKILSGCMIIAIIIAVFGKAIHFDKYIFWVEAVGIWSFSLFWYFKTREVNPKIPWHPHFRFNTKRFVGFIESIPDPSIENNSLNLGSSEVFFSIFSK